MAVNNPANLNKQTRKSLLRRYARSMITQKRHTLNRRRRRNSIPGIPESYTHVFTHQPLAVVHMNKKGLFWVGETSRWCIQYTYCLN